jgi:hypothetical protein
MKLVGEKKTIFASKVRPLKVWNNKNKQVTFCYLIFKYILHILNIIKLIHISYTYFGSNKKFRVQKAYEL